MKLNPDKNEMVQDLAIKTRGALTVYDRHKKTLRKIAVEKYDWQNISRRLATDLYGLR
jgi:hypothetical protein